ncbi:Imm51 family immunity protein [Phytomonospora sp. NPDC050363]|uniref:Imm51 family immunity protein n=1 Tax=Phytomonospora sp. NPDC050363 TaxID=3155642 RepID=UPI0033D223E5
MLSESDFSGFTAAKFVGGSTASSVIFSPGGPVDAHLSGVFGARGLEGGGYDWQGAVHALVLERDPALAERFRFDSEAGMFCAYGEDVAALHAVAAVLEELLGDADLLDRALAAAAEADLLD